MCFYVFIDFHVVSSDYGFNCKCFWKFFFSFFLFSFWEFSLKKLPHFWVWSFVTLTFFCWSDCLNIFLCGLLYAKLSFDAHYDWCNFILVRPFELGACMCGHVTCVVVMEICVTITDGSRRCDKACMAVTDDSCSCYDICHLCDQYWLLRFWLAFHWLYKRWGCRLRQERDWWGISRGCNKILLQA